MTSLRKDSNGFSSLEAVLIVVMVGIIGIVGWYVWQAKQNTDKITASNTQIANSSAKFANKTKTTTSKITPANPYTDWKTFTDDNSANSSGISIKYPSDWQVNTTATKATAWTVGTSQGRIGVSYLFLNNSDTAQQEWHTCITTDECGVGGGKIVTGNESTVNELDVYTATMQDDNGKTYYAAVVRGNKPDPEGTPYVDFTFYNADQTSQSIFDKIIASATFPN